MTAELKQLQLFVAKQGGALAALMGVLIAQQVIPLAALRERLDELGKYDTTDEERAATSVVVGLLTRALTLKHGH